MAVANAPGEQIFPGELAKGLCVQQRLARSAGDRPAGVRARAL